MRGWPEARETSWGPLSASCYSQTSHSNFPQVSKKREKANRRSFVHQVARRGAAGAYVAIAAEIGGADGDFFCKSEHAQRTDCSNHSPRLSPCGRP